DSGDIVQGGFGPSAAFVVRTADGPAILLQGKSPRGSPTIQDCRPSRTFSIRETAGTRFVPAFYAGICGVRRLGGARGGVLGRQNASAAVHRRDVPSLCRIAGSAAYKRALSCSARACQCSVVAGCSGTGWLALPCSSR